MPARIEQIGAQGERRVYFPRAETLGGSSSINAMIYIRSERHEPVPKHGMAVHLVPHR
jgi:choline dehydrogenase-like flavoprotein